MGKQAKTQLPNWLHLPEDITLKILSKVCTIDVLKNVKGVCTTWRRMCKDPFIWRNINISDLGYNMEKICCKAVDDSDGQLEYMEVQLFATDQFLKHIADRITDKGLIEAVQKLPLLEEIEIAICRKITEQALEVVGSSCPLLKSFKLNRWIYESYPERTKLDSDALAVAGNMHGLRHLQLFGNQLTNVGLEAILDRCPYLESLDLRMCFNINLEGKLGKRCAKQIKDLQCIGYPGYDGECIQGIVDGFEAVHNQFHASSSLL